jgi:hypothetical protein
MGAWIEHDHALPDACLVMYRPGARRKGRPQESYQLRTDEVYLRVCLRRNPLVQTTVDKGDYCLP